MNKSQAKQLAIEILLSNGYKILGDIVTEPEFGFDFIGIQTQDKLSDIVFDENGTKYTFKVQQVNNKLKLIEVEL